MERAARLKRPVPTRAKPGWLSASAAVVFTLTALAACEADPPRGTGNPNGDSGLPPSGDGSVGVPDPTDDNCTVMRARWVYVVDNDNTLYRFEPDSLTFIPIGSLACDPNSTPFSMSVDRNATAYVLYQTGDLYQVSTADASCQPTSFVPHQHGFELFGMGFVADDEENTSETLFVAGGPASEVGGSGRIQLATIDVGSLTLTPRGQPFVGLPELTGTGDGQLWGFIPGIMPNARRINKDTGAPDLVIPITAAPVEEPRAWAFAFWGGRYYIFLQSGMRESTNVYRMDPTDQSSELVLENTGLTIVGAGVSTCAPTTLI